jgi:hypothetical protein
MIPCRAHHGETDEQAGAAVVEDIVSAYGFFRSHEFNDVLMVSEAFAFASSYLLMANRSIPTNMWMRNARTAAGVPARLCEGERLANTRWCCRRDEGCVSFAKDNGTFRYARRRYLGRVTV